MPFFASTYHSRIYRDFKALEAHNFREVVRYFEKHEAEILQLQFEEYFEILAGYANALFEIGAYRKHTLMADVVIELSIRHNIQDFQGVDIFRQMLFRKAASLYNLYEQDKAEYILRELIKIDATDSDSIRFLDKCRQRQYPVLLNRFRAVSIFLFFLTAAVIAVEVLLIIPFYNMHALAVSQIRIGIFLLGIGAMLAGHGCMRWLAHRDVRRFLESLPQKK